MARFILQILLEIKMVLFESGNTACQTFIADLCVGKITTEDSNMCMALIYQIVDYCLRSRSIVCCQRG